MYCGTSRCQLISFTVQELQFVVTRTSDFEDQYFLRSPKISRRRCHACDGDKDLSYIWKSVWLVTMLGGNSDKKPLAFVLMV